MTWHDVGSSDLSWLTNTSGSFSSAISANPQNFWLWQELMQSARSCVQDFTVSSHFCYFNLWGHPGFHVGYLELLWSWQCFSTWCCQHIFFSPLLPLVPSSICIFCPMEEVTAQHNQWSFLLKLVHCPCDSLLLILVFSNYLISHVSLHKKQDERTV